MIRLESSKLWVCIEQLATNAQCKMAAVAYVSDSSRIKFTRGDTLIVDASDKQIASGATSARVLIDAFNGGVKLYSLPNLHAKLMVLDNIVVVGSTNISDLSVTALKEAGIISDSPQLVAEALATIDNLKRGAQRVDRRFINRISRIKVIRTGGDGQPSGNGQSKPTLLEAFETNSPLLDDFVFMMLEGEATLTSRQIREAAKKKRIKLPASDRWKWYQFDSDEYPDKLFQKLFVKRRFKILGLVVESQNDRVQRAVELEPYCLIYVNHVRIGRSIAFNCLVDKRTPFKISTKSTKPICTELTRALQSTPALGKKLFKSNGWIVTMKDIAELLQGIP